MAKNALVLSAFIILALVQGSPRAEDLLDIYRLAIAEDPQFKQRGSAKRAVEESRTQARSRLLL
ncbi:MAG: TolC family outer membrane protein, partial [Gammaproteobacteria bacterium]